MNYLIDTHTFLWFINDDPALSVTAKHLIEDSENMIYLSIASVWEMAIKVSLGKLDAPSPFTDFINDQLRENNFVLLQIKPEHTGIVSIMPFHHRDPFDRLLLRNLKVKISQSLVLTVFLMLMESREPGNHIISSFHPPRRVEAQTPPRPIAAH